MSIEANKAVVREFYDLVDAHRVDELDRLFAAGYVDHNPYVPTGDLAGVKRLIGMFLTAFPDLRLTVDSLIAEGDRVASRLSFRGTHRGPMMGMPPTGRPAHTTGSAIFRVADRRIAEEWFELDLLGTLRQLGAAPGEGPAA